mmetsp:Transcript_5201/g.11787  ORF Transcript_5201/g.11787 Transcript_5201/m.11787 type:complete len:229 (-) Transcript_5201:739-1425(-)
MRPMMPSMAKRPLLSSLTWLNFQSASFSSTMRSLQPRTSQGFSGGGGHGTVHIHSKHMMVKTTCQMPPMGIWVTAIMGSSETRTPFAKSPMGCQPAAVWNQPKQASMQTRPCLSSTARQWSNCSSVFPFARPAGSQKSSGNGPPVPSKILGPARNVVGESEALRGESVYKAQSPQAEPVRPSWKNMPMMATIARRPLASSAFKLFFRFSGSSILAMMPTDLAPRKPAP